MADDIFKKATRLKLRFNHNGLISTEDLWDLNLPALNSIAKNVNAKVKSFSAEEDFISNTNRPSAAQVQAELSLEVLKAIIAVKLEEKEIAATLSKKRAERQKILEILDQKADDTLKSKSVEDLRAMLKEYED